MSLFAALTYAESVASPRQSVPRGTRVGSGPRPARPSRKYADPPPVPEDVADPTKPRHVIDYALQRRATLKGLFRQGLRDDVCDADPMLLRTAKYHGEPSQISCPVCRRAKLTHLTYTFSPEFGETDGRVRATKELPSLAVEYSAFRVYVVEVCEDCGWNHLVLSYVLGDGVPRRRTGTGG